MILLVPKEGVKKCIYLKNEATYKDTVENRGQHFIVSLISLFFLLLDSKPESAGGNCSICNSSGSLGPVTQPCPQLSFPSSFLVSALASPLNFAFLGVMIN